MAVKVSENRRAGMALVGLVIKGNPGGSLTASPTITTGVGVPSASEPNGSIYMRVDGTAGNTIYARAAGAWSALA
jgi:hypothetical protein